MRLRYSRFDPSLTSPLSSFLFTQVGSQKRWNFCRYPIFANISAVLVLLKLEVETIDLLSISNLRSYANFSAVFVPHYSSSMSETHSWNEFHCCVDYSEHSSLAMERMFANLSFISVSMLEITVQEISMFRRFLFNIFHYWHGDHSPTSPPF